jgi:hypothetical protein
VWVSVLAVGCHHIDSCVEVHRIGALAVSYGICARVIVSLGHVVSRASVHRIDASVVGADEVCTVRAVNLVVAVPPSTSSAPSSLDTVSLPLPSPHSR